MKPFALHASVICPEGGAPPRSSDLADLLEVAYTNAQAGRPCALLMVFHADGGAARTAVDAAAWTLERTL